MILHEPFEIGSRLLPAVRVAGAEISLERTDKKGRLGHAEWRWHIDIPAGEFEGGELYTHHGTQAAFADLLTFLECVPGEEDADYDSFPRPVVEWALKNLEEIGLLRLEIEETEGLVEE